MLRENQVELEGAPSTAKRLRGRVAVVTGSSRGIGRAIARALATEGASVAVHYCRGEEQAASLAAEIEHLGAKARLVQGDLGRPEDCHKVLTLAARELGPVEILVNNAGVNRDRTLRKMTAAEWDEVIQVNLNSVFHCTKAALEPMIARGWAASSASPASSGRRARWGRRTTRPPRRASSPSPRAWRRNWPGSALP